MKLLLFLISSITAFSCANNTINPDREKKQLNTNAMQLIDKNTTMLKLAVGEVAYYKASIHGSVGIAKKVEIDNEEVLKVKNSKVEYRNKDRVKMPGGDAATRTYIFEALKVGEAKLTIQKIFRGRLESKRVISCTISEK